MQRQIRVPNPYTVSDSHRKSQIANRKSQLLGDRRKN